VIASIADGRLLRDTLLRHRPVAVVHFAAFAYVGESTENPGLYYRNNVVGTLALLEAMRECGVRYLVFSSSCAVYGVPAVVPIQEQTPLNPVNPYGATKMMCERMLRDCAEAFPLKWIALRYFNASGSDPDGEIGECHVPETHVIPLVLDAAAGRRDAFTVFGTDYPTPDGTCIRDYIHVSDLADAHVLALRILLQGGESEAINVGTGSGWSVLELVEIAREKSRTATFRSYSARVVPETRQPSSVIRNGRASGSNGCRVTRILPNTCHTLGRGAKAAACAEPSWGSYKLMHS